jgi:hypothetical protein
MVGTEEFENLSSAKSLLGDAISHDIYFNGRKKTIESPDAYGIKGFNAGKITIRKDQPPEKLTSGNKISGNAGKQPGPKEKGGRVESLRMDRNPPADHPYFWLAAWTRFVSHGSWRWKSGNVPRGWQRLCLAAVRFGKSS